MQKMPLSISLRGFATQTPAGETLLLPFEQIHRDSLGYLILNQNVTPSCHPQCRVNIGLLELSSCIQRLTQRKIRQQLQSGNYRMRLKCKRAGITEWVFAIGLFVWTPLLLMSSDVLSRGRAYSPFETPTPIWVWCVLTVLVIMICVLPLLLVVLKARTLLTRMTAAFSRRIPTEIRTIASGIVVEYSDDTIDLFRLCEIESFVRLGGIRLKSRRSIMFDVVQDGISCWRTFYLAANRAIGAAHQGFFVKGSIPRSTLCPMLLISTLLVIAAISVNFKMDVQPDQRNVTVAIGILHAIICLPFVINWRRVRHWLRRNNQTKILAMFAPSCSFKA